MMFENGLLPHFARELGATYRARVGRHRISHVLVDA
jgi:hypothetical protein